MSKQALGRYQADQQHYAQPAQPVDAAAARANPALAASRSGWGSADGYYADRDRDLPSFRAQASQNTTYVYVMQHSRPNYGSWDTVFLTALVTHAVDSSYYNWAYSHRDDAGYQAWHADQMRLAGENGELRAQMSALDAKVAELQARNAPAQPAAELPPGVTPAIAIAPAAVIADAQDGAGWGSHWLLWTIALLTAGGVAFCAVMIRRGKAA
jgi:hypothetical protein